MLEHATIAQDPTGAWNAASGRVGMTVEAGESRLWKRRAMRPFAEGGEQRACMLVGELDGVRTYVVEKAGQVHIIMSRQDLRPEFGA